MHNYYVYLTLGLLMSTNTYSVEKNCGDKPNSAPDTVIRMLGKDCIEYVSDRYTVSFDTSRGTYCGNEKLSINGGTVLQALDDEEAKRVFSRLATLCKPKESVQK